MNLRPILLALFLVIACMQSLQAQQVHRISIGLGTSYYYGELTDGYELSFLRPAFQLSYGMYIDPRWHLDIGVSYTQLSAADSTSNYIPRLNRNLHFRTSLVEISGMAYFEILRDKHLYSLWHSKLHMTPYVFGGVALIAFNPQAKFNDIWYDLQPLGTEGQFIEGEGEPYSRLQVSIPFGAGMSVKVNRQIGLSLEVGYRLTFTDYLDDISTDYPNKEALFDSRGSTALALSDPSLDVRREGSIRGNPETNDGYIMVTFKLTYYIKRYKIKKKLSNK